MEKKSVSDFRIITSKSDSATSKPHEYQFLATKFNRFLSQNAQKLCDVNILKISQNNIKYCKFFTFYETRG